MILTIGPFSGTGRYYQLNIWESSYSVADNSSVVSWTLEAMGESTGYDYSLYAATNWEVLFSESGGWKNSFPSTSGATKGTCIVPHNPDGSQSINVVLEGYARVYSTQTASGTLTLSNIPRTSTITTNVSKMGTAGNIYISKANASFTHTLTYAFGNASGTIATKTSASTVSWTPPTTLAAQIPNATYGTCTIVCKTYNGNTEIGSTSKTFNLYIPDNNTPSLTSITATQSGNATAIGWGVYVAGKSKATVTFNGAAAGYGSTINSYKVVCESYSDTTSPFETAYLTAGTKTIYGYVYDKRGRSTYKTATVTVQAYAAPYITNIECFRSTQGGTQDDEGTYITFKAKQNISSCAGHNSATLTYQLLNKSGGVVTSGSFTTETYKTIGGSLAINQSYTLKLKIQDAFENQEYLQEVSSANVAFNIKPGGTAVAVGKYAEDDNTFDIGPGWKLGKNLLNAIYPVGIIICSDSSSNPSTYLGGTWVAIENRVIIGKSSTYTTNGGSTTNTHNHKLTSAYACISRGTGATADYMAMIWKKYSTSFTSSLYMNTNSGVSATAKTSDGSTALGGTTDNNTTNSNMMPYTPEYLWKRTA